ncbi:hypothetical protein L596_018072 [Steinernema carpocapsae]|uniref:Peptidase M13 C-terminal domain-containing protein n=1 Tax=Steinernema carpocapsae TaxID=34508 RepID=A0A4U5N4A6_STECR|nr:hypothetical protein L596_018072 [Steinernema carpocapsae]
MSAAVHLLPVLLALLASLTLPVSASSRPALTKFPTPSELKKAFDSSVSPCEDIHAHTCNRSNPVIQDFVDKANNHAMAKDLIKLADLDDPVFKTLLQEFEKLDKCEFPNIGDPPEEDEEFGKYLGQLHATGGCASADCVREIVVECDATENQPHCELYRFGKNRSLAVNYTSLEDKFVQGFIYGYLNALDVSDEDISRFTVENNTFPINEGKNLTNYTQTYVSEEHWRSIKEAIGTYQPNCSSEVCVEKHRDLMFNLSMKNNFAPYFNLFFAKVMYEHPNETKVDYIKDMDNLLDEVQNQIKKQVENSSNYSAAFKSRVNKHLETINIVNAFSPEFRNLTYLEDLLTEFQNFTLKDLSPDSCNLKLIINLITAFRNRRLIAKEPLIIPLLPMVPFEHVLFQTNAAYWDGRMHIFPGYLYPLQQEVPVGFKYGYVAVTISHELFHGLAPQIPERIIGFAEEQHFLDAETCYVNYYGSQQFCLKDGLENTKNKTCPEGSKKWEEGYCDSESIRVVFSVLKKALKQKADETRNKRSTVERLLPHFDSPPVEEFFSDGSKTYDQEKWFFKAFSLALCGSGNYSERLQLEENIHPRHTIRVNAAVRQTKNFAKVFKCKKEDPNYTIEPICSAYTVDEEFADLDAPKEAPSTTEATISHVEVAVQEGEIKSSKKCKPALILVFSLVAFFL